MNIKAKVKPEILFLILLVLASFSFSAPGSIDSIGGTITGLAISLTTSTSTWQGYFGHVDLTDFGYNVPNPWINFTGENGTINHTSGLNISTHVGYLLVVNNTDTEMVNVESLTNASLNDIDNLIGPGYDKASNLFTTQTTFVIEGENQNTITNVPTLYLNQDNQSQSTNFREGILKDTVTGNFVYIVDLYTNSLSSYNSSQAAYQYIVPNINQGYSVFVYLQNTKPTVTLTYPSGGESWPSNTVQTIEWSMLDIDTGASNLNVSLYYLDGSNWILINDTLQGVTSYDWTIPLALDLPSTKINVTVTDDGSLSSSSVSASTFEITPSDLTPPTVTILHPNSTAIYTTSTVDLNVTTSEATDTCLYNIGSGNNTMDGSGTQFSKVLDVSSSDTIYNLIVYCNDTVGLVGVNDLVNFTVDNIAPTITLDSPADNQNITGTITLTASVIDADVQNVSFEYYNGTWNTIGINNTPSTTFTLEWNTTGLDATNMTIRATATDNADWQDSDTSTNIEIDNTAPSQITDLKALMGSDEGEIDLQWTAVGDDTTTGTATSYIIKQSASEITEGTWASATTVSQSIAPQTSGNPESFTVADLNNATQYYFAIKAVDNLGLQSTISNSPTNSTRSHDLAVTQIYSPASTNINTATDIIAEIENHGNVQESSVVKFYVDNIYQSNQTITNLAAGSKINKTFSWTPEEEGVNVELKFEIQQVAYETQTVDNIKSKSINVLASHDVSVDFITHNKLATTIYKYDLVNVSGNVSNKGQVDENITVRLHNGDMLEKNVSIPAGQTKEVSFIWDATTSGWVYLTATIPFTETDNTNNDKSEYLSVYSIKDNINLDWYDAANYPVPLGSGNENADFYVGFNVQNQNVNDLSDIPLYIDINGTYTVMWSQDGSNTDTTLFDVLGSDTSNYWWQIADGLAVGTYNVTVTAGNNAQDSTSISRLIDVAG